MFESCTAKKVVVKELFSDCPDPESKYERIIELGKAVPILDSEFKVDANRVQGCQSRMYLRSYMENGLVYFEAEADSLISSGLAALLIRVYSGEAPETILKCPADYLLELGINASLTMNRANGLASMHLHMKRAALTLLMQEEQSKT